MVNLKNIFISFVVIFYLCSSSTNQERANEQANAKSLQAIANIPRYGGDTEMNKEDFEDLINGEEPTYFIGIGSLFAGPMILVLLSALICPFYTIWRCCKCCCCKKTKPKNPITKKQIYMRYIIVLLCSIVIVVMSGIAYGANTDFSGALLYNSGTGEDGNLFSVAETFMSDGVNKVDDISSIITGMKSDISYVVDGVQSLLNDTSILGTGTSSLLSMLYAIAALWNNYNVTTTYANVTYSFQCEFCTTISSTINNITVQVDDQVGPIFDDLNTTITEIDSSLVSAESDILSEIDNFVDEINDVRDTLYDTEQEVIDFRPDMEDMNDKRELGYNIIFAIPLLPIIFILFGGILKQSICFTLSYISLWFSCTLMFLLLAFHLPIAVLLNDTCNFLDTVDQNVTKTFNNTGGEIFEACLDDSKLTTVLGLDGSLNFTNQIEFPSLGNITDDFTFSSLLTFETDADNTDFTTFYQNGDLALVTINNLTINSPFVTSNSTHQHMYTRSNISSLNATIYYPSNTTFHSTLESLIDIVMAEQASVTAFNDTLNKIRANLSSVSFKVSEIENNVQDLADKVDNASYLLNPLFNSVEDIIDTATCGFVGDAYIDTKSVMCSSVLGSLSRIVVSMFIVGLLSLISCISSIKLVRKVEWWQKQKLDEKELKLQQSFQPNKPSIIVMQPQQMPNNQYQPGQHTKGIVQGQAVYFNSSQNV